jgi:hypothetical protein
MRGVIAMKVKSEDTVYYSPGKTLKGKVILVSAVVADTMN